MTTKTATLTPNGAFLIQGPVPESPTSGPPVGATRPFCAIAWVEGRWTGDGRFVMVDAVTWDGLLPVPLTVDHEGVEETIGRVDSVERVPGATAGERFIVVRGEMGLTTPLQVEMDGLISSHFADGVSMELDAMVEGGIDPDTAPGDMPPGSGGWVTVVESARFRALSVVTTPAFVEARITFAEEPDLENVPPALEGPAPKTADEMPPPEDMPEDVIIVAAAGHTIVMPQVPPAEWFQEPDMIDGGLTVTDEGRVYGWLAPANVPYSGVHGNFTVPMGNVNYSRWQNRVTVVDDGTRLMTGNITMGCGHGDTQTVDHQVVRDHYDNSCSLFARVAAGENQHGVWIAGALYPGVTGEQIARAMGLQCSGHWIPSTAPGFTYDLEAALLVPVPAFNAARRVPSVTMRDGALAASSVPVQFETDCGCAGHGAVNADAVVSLASIEARLERLEREARPALVASMRARINGTE